MKYLLLITLVCFLLSSSAYARDLDFSNRNDQLYMGAIAAGTYIVGTVLVRSMGWDRTQGYLGGAIIVGTTAFLIDYYSDKTRTLDKNKTAGVMVGVGVAITLSLGFGL